MNGMSKCDDFWQFSLKIWPLVLFLSPSGEISPEKKPCSVSYTHIQIAHFPKLVTLIWFGNVFESCIPFPAGTCFEHYKTHTQLICSNPCTLVLGGYQVGTLVYTPVVQVSTWDNICLIPGLYQSQYYVYTCHTPAKNQPWTLKPGSEGSNTSTRLVWNF
jgi:hypothetical protein